MKPALHMEKLFVGLDGHGALDAYQRGRAGQVHPVTGRKELAHVTRTMPKRASELLAGGSMYWVMSNAIVARQRLAGLRAIVVDGVPHCAIILARPLIPVLRMPHRPFQGWRYLRADAAPPDMSQPMAGHDPADADGIATELARLGLA